MKAQNVIIIALLGAAILLAGCTEQPVAGGATPTVAQVTKLPEPADCEFEVTAEAGVNKITYTVVVKPTVHVPVKVILEGRVLDDNKAVLRDFYEATPKLTGGEKAKVVVNTYTDGGSVTLQKLTVDNGIALLKGLPFLYEGKVINQ